MAEIDEIMVVRLACSKLCHDLISPVSAVNNGLELVGVRWRPMPRPWT
ncbi:MAG: hypothetical protein R3F55_18070 [Alphaproteobacteria bacterium]